ncbi:hypothetical protein PpBr36_08355 [Pyricularia pennisetigena]|uniref:hypothetical protein n=1 Tax=Pyricularia pennisetigena TaxID=1578925 RepID=UPI001151CD81|nr:hypothetical protein PpBr36_08355 [Pyricularia pennisetigena]TLS24505.1 hypothetical protein PpBr36_08355 [Pyricularia pennisetigena]
MKLPQLLGQLCLSFTLAAAVDLTGYEYIVVGSGAGGGPLAVRLAMAGKKTLLLEAGDDQGASHNYTVPAYHSRASEDDAMSWDFFVRNYADEAQQARNFKTTYETPDGGEYTGLNPPAGSKMKGVLYPRTGTLGGCTAHNAMVTIYPFRSDFDDIARLTGDDSWSAGNMRKYFVKMEENRHLLPDKAGHGYSGWLTTQTAPLTIALGDPQLLGFFVGGAAALTSWSTNLVFNLATLFAGDANEDSALRDSRPGNYQVPLSTRDGARVSSRDFIVAVRDAKNPDGSKMYPLDVRTDAFVTKVLFDNSTTSPRATGVEFLDGKYLYRASRRSKNAGPGVPGTATASREVILAGGAYNSPQILKLSGIGPAAELQRLAIPVVKDLPGVGSNLQDHYEVSVQGTMPSDFSSLRGCTFAPESTEDPCLTRWENPILGNRGIYSSSGFATALYHKSKEAKGSDWDVFAFGGPADFRGYFPGYSVNATARKNVFSWAVLKAHPRSAAGSVTLRTADPLDVPDIVYDYFKDGGSDKDLRAMTEGIRIGRNALKLQLLGQPLHEDLPGDDVQTDEQIATFIRDTAWGHHASSTCAIGRDDDPMAVLDSSFRVRGVSGLRVADASVYPRIPGTFTAVSTYMIGEKAADVILAGEGA